MFEQKHEAGREGSFDFTDASELGVTIAGEVFAHLFFQFVLSFSKWRWVGLAFSETFEALVHGLQNALWELGGVPPVWRSDNLSAATHQIPGGGRELNRRYATVLQHYGVKSTRIEPGESHQNGVAEKAHDVLKSALDQELVLRGSRDFATIDAYMALVGRVRDRIISGKASSLLAEERQHLLPAAADARARVHDVHGDGSAVEHYPLRASGLLGAVATHRLRGRGAAAPRRGRGLLPRPASRPRRCRGCAAIATITSTTGTSSGRSSANLGPSHATDSARSSFRRSCSGAPTTRWSTHAASAPTSSTCASCTWPRARCSPPSRPC